MASGDPVVQIIRYVQPRATSAYPHEVAGASTPAERLVYWRFDDAATAYLDLVCRLHGYDGGGLTFQFAHDTNSGTLANAVRIGAAIRRIQDDAEDLDTTAQTYDYNDATFTTSSARGELAVDTIAFTSGADMDGLLNNEDFILRIRRQPADAADNLGGNWLLWAVTGYET